jgi:hypothetical protein
MYDVSGLDFAAKLICFEMTLVARVNALSTKYLTGSAYCKSLALLWRKTDLELVRQ